MANVGDFLANMLLGVVVAGQERRKKQEEQASELNKLAFEYGLKRALLPEEERVKVDSILQKAYIEAQIQKLYPTPEQQARTEEVRTRTKKEQEELQDLPIKQEVERQKGIKSARENVLSNMNPIQQGLARMGFMKIPVPSLLQKPVGTETAGRVRVRYKSGRVGTIPQSQLDEAVQSGDYQVVP